MIDASKLPTVPSALVQSDDEATTQGQATAYVRAPVAAGPQPTGARPPAVQWSKR
jgi:hypothetical protein